MRRLAQRADEGLQARGRVRIVAALRGPLNVGAADQDTVRGFSRPRPP